MRSGWGRWAWAAAVPVSFLEDPLDLRVEGGCYRRWGRSTGSRPTGLRSAEQATEVQRGDVTYATSHSLVGSLELDGALASERPRVPPEGCGAPGKDRRWPGGVRGGLSALSDGLSGAQLSCARGGGGMACTPSFSFACVNACVYILLISVSGICILSGLVCWAGFLEAPDLKGIFQLQYCCSLCNKQQGVSEGLVTGG